MRAAATPLSPTVDVRQGAERPAPSWLLVHVPVRHRRAPPPASPPGRSVISASVVSSSEATDAAFCSATRSTLVGSMMPACDHVHVLHASPRRSRGSAPSRPSPSRRSRCPRGRRSRRSGGWAPRARASRSWRRPSRRPRASGRRWPWRARSSATPPPGTMPSSTAARVALSASSTRAFFSFISVSVAAPDLDRPPRRRPAWPAAPAASRGRSREVVSSIWARICLMRPSIVAVLPAPSTIVVLSLSTTTFLALPRSSSLMFSSLMPRSSVMALPPVRIAMSSSMALRRSPKPGAFTAPRVQRAAELVDDQGGQRLALDVLGDDQERLAGARHLLEQRQHVLHHADLLLVDQDERVLEHDLHALGVGHEVRARGSRGRTACPRPRPARSRPSSTPRR